MNLTPSSYPLRGALVALLGPSICDEVRGGTAFTPANRIIGLSRRPEFAHDDHLSNT
jgi:hypothetical protein